VRGFEPAPAYAISARFDVLAHNRPAGRLFGDLGPGPGGPANMLHLGFTVPHWRTLIADWDQEAARHVAMYRAAMTIHLDDSAWTALPARLAQLSPDFARFWASSDVAGPERGLKRFRHPSAGPLTLHSTSLLMADDPMIRIVILYPATASDAAKLERRSATAASSASSWLTRAIASPDLRVSPSRPTISVAVMTSRRTYRIRPNGPGLRRRGQHRVDRPQGPVRAPCLRVPGRRHGWRLLRP
jgi:MmyB-like transcription regulator ligand binding domain